MYFHNQLSVFIFILECRWSGKKGSFLSSLQLTGALALLELKPESSISYSILLWPISKTKILVLLEAALNEVKRKIYNSKVLSNWCYLLLSLKEKKKKVRTFLPRASLEQFFFSLQSLESTLNTVMTDSLGYLIVYSCISGF